MSNRDHILDLAARHEQAATDVEARGARGGFDASKAAAEERDIALILRAAAAEMLSMSPAAQQDYAHRLKFALWQRVDDSPEVRVNREDPL